MPRKSSGNASPDTEKGVMGLSDAIYDQNEEIEQFLIEVTETEEYKSVEYLVFSILKPMLDYFTLLRNKDNKFRIPAFLVPLVNRVGELFCAKGISGDNILNYMEKNNSHGWIMYYDTAFIRKPGMTGTIQVDADFLFLIITGFILDTFGKKYVNINEMVEGEQFAYETNQYGLTPVPGVVFKEDSFIFDGKAYVYNLLTNKSKIEFFDTMPGFARIITDDVNTGNILLRLDERLAVPADQIISYSTLNFEKFRGPQFHFSDTDLEKAKTIIVHIDTETCDKLLMVIKKDYDNVLKKSFMHIEIETLPYYPTGMPNSPCITTFLHGMYFPEDDYFTHIDYTKNQYLYSDYEKKYADADPQVPVDFYAEKKLHYKIWCIENGKYSRETWYKLMVVSLPKKYHVLLDEILA